MVGVYFDVLVWDLLFFEDGPGALDKGAEPAGVEFEGFGVGVLGDCGCCEAGGGGVEFGVGVVWVCGHDDDVVFGKFGLSREEIRRVVDGLRH